MAGRPEEYFEAVAATGLPPHPGDYLAALPRTGAGIRDDPTPARAPAYSSLAGLRDYRQHLERTFAAGTTANGVFGAKLMFNQLAELETLAGTLEEYAGLRGTALLEALFTRPRYIWVSRRDKVRQAVSMWRALQSRRWRARPGEGREPAAEPVYRFDGIDHLVQRFTAEDRGWAELFGAHAITPLRIVYEDDLQAGGERAVAAALAHIGVTAPAGRHTPEPTAPQADDRSEAWVAAYHRDRAQRERAAGGASSGTSARRP